MPEKSQLLLKRSRPIGHAFEPVDPHLLEVLDLLALNLLDHLAAFFGLVAPFVLGFGGVLCSSLNMRWIFWYCSARSDRAWPNPARLRTNPGSFRNRQNKRPRRRGTWRPSFSTSLGVPPKPARLSQMRRRGIIPF